MKKITLFTLFLFPLSSFAATTNVPITSPTGVSNIVYRIITNAVGNQNILQVRSNLLGGLATNALGSGGASSLQVKEIDGTPAVLNVSTVRVSNATLTDDGNGQVTLTIGGIVATNAAGSTVEVQFRNGTDGTFAADATFFFNSTNKLLSVPNIAISTNLTAGTVASTNSITLGGFSLYSITNGNLVLFSTNGAILTISLAASVLTTNNAPDIETLPGASKYYGTDSGGIKGFFNLPFFSGGGVFVKAVQISDANFTNSPSVIWDFTTTNVFAYVTNIINNQISATANIDRTKLASGTLGAVIYNHPSTGFPTDESSMVYDPTLNSFVVNPSAAFGAGVSVGPVAATNGYIELRSGSDTIAGTINIGTPSVGGSIYKLGGAGIDTNLNLTMPTNGKFHIRGSVEVTNDFRSYDGHFSNTLQRAGLDVVDVTRSLLIAGTAMDITSSAGSQDLSANRTWTLSLSRNATLAINPSLSAGFAAFATTGLIFEGATADALEGLLTTDDITATDKTWTLPNRSGTFSLSGDTFNGAITGTLESDGSTTTILGAITDRTKLPTAIAYEDETNTFTLNQRMNASLGIGGDPTRNIGLTLRGTVANPPIMDFYMSDAPAEHRRWDIVQSTNRLAVRIVDDALTFGKDIIAIDRLSTNGLNIVLSNAAVYIPNLTSDSIVSVDSNKKLASKTGTDGQVLSILGGIPGFNNVADLPYSKVLAGQNNNALTNSNLKLIKPLKYGQDYVNGGALVVSWNTNAYIYINGTNNISITFTNLPSLTNEVQTMHINGTNTGAFSINISDSLFKWHLHETPTLPSTNDFFIDVQWNGRTLTGFLIATAPVAGGTVAGSNTQIQYNNSGSFGASTNLAFTNSTATLMSGNATIKSNLISATSTIGALTSTTASVGLITTTNGGTTAGLSYVVGANGTMTATNEINADTLNLGTPMQLNVLTNGSVAGQVLQYNGTSNGWQLPKFPPVVLAYAGGTNITVDYNAGRIFKLRLTNTAFFATPSNAPTTNESGTLTLQFQQDATGGRVVTWTNASYKFSSNTIPIITTNAGAVSVVTLISSTFTNGQFYGSGLPHFQ